MSSLILSGDVSGTVTLDAPSSAGNTVLTLPSTTGTILTTTGGVAPGTSGNALVSNGTTWTSGKQTITSGTAVASTSGTSIDFTGIPSWVKRITVMFNGVSTNGTSFVQVQIGSGSVTTSGYISSASYSNGTGAFSYISSGFQTDVSNTSSPSTYARHGIMQIALVGSNTWVASGTIGFGAVAQVTTATGGSSPALSGALDRIRITTVNGTDTFDAGSINILYE